MLSCEQSNTVWNSIQRVSMCENYINITIKSTKYMQFKHNYLFLKESATCFRLNM